MTAFKKRKFAIINDKFFAEPYNILLLKNLFDVHTAKDNLNDTFKNYDESSSLLRKMFNLPKAPIKDEQVLQSFMTYFGKKNWGHLRSYPSQYFPCLAFHIYATCIQTQQRDENELIKILRTEGANQEKWIFLNNLFDKNTQQKTRDELRADPVFRALKNILYHSEQRYEILVEFTKSYVGDLSRTESHEVKKACQQFL